MADLIIASRPRLYSAHEQNSGWRIARPRVWPSRNLQSLNLQLQWREEATMTNQSEIFGRLLRGAINSIAAYEGKSAASVEEELGSAIGLSGAAIQRYKAGAIPPEPR